MQSEVFGVFLGCVHIWCWILAWALEHVDIPVAARTNHKAALLRSLSAAGRQGNAPNTKHNKKPSNSPPSVVELQVLRSLGNSVAQLRCVSMLRLPRVCELLPRPLSMANLTLADRQRPSRGGGPHFHQAAPPPTMMRLK